MDKMEEELCQLAELYALGGLNETDLQQFEAHLEGCAACREQVKELRKLTDILPLAAVQVPPPAGMKSRVLGKILAGREAGGESGNPAPTPKTINGPEPEPEFISAGTRNPVPAPPPKLSGTPAKHSNKRLRYVSVVLAAAAASLTIYAAALQRDVGALRQELAESSEQVSGLQAQLALAGAPSQELKVNEAVQLGPAAEDIIARGLATIVIDAKGTHLLVQAEKLPKLSGSEAFQVWLIKGDVKKSAGTFLASEGTGAMYYTFDPQGYDTVAITQEPDSRGEQPRGRLILAAPIEG
ncbi:hypothetical protein GCM10010912_44160 [Paenibacillus albidus]|uniref:Anti-sigma-W factor RsiW n=1 Tax=Paenibacillus albidus TaxID=2041023 RepID=A0A917CP03_9BACL|nr:anti-sigma factor [Paenibacillus albidus]GGF94363.1 hypothetical protein GCM10010912_44160 [Paenibacillus albidus]